MDRHYTYDEIKKAVFSKDPMPEEMLEHFAVCEECMEIFLNISLEMPVTPPMTAVVNILERAAMKRQKIKDMMFNMRVVFGVMAAIMMLFSIPLTPKENVDIIRHNREKMASMAEKKEEFRQDVSENIENFIEFYKKGNINNNDTPEE